MSFCACQFWSPWGELTMSWCYNILVNVTPQVFTMHFLKALPQTKQKKNVQFLLGKDCPFECHFFFLFSCFPTCICKPAKNTTFLGGGSAQIIRCCCCCCEFYWWGWGGTFQLLQPLEEAFSVVSTFTGYRAMLDLDHLGERMFWSLRSLAQICWAWL